MSGPTIDRALVARLADLAQLELAEAELSRVTHELGAILAYAEELATVDVTGVEPMDRPFAGEDAARADEPRADEGEERLALRDGVLASAPRAHDGGFDVPSFVDEG